jgi:hypothetical protein
MNGAAAAAAAAAAVAKAIKASGAIVRVEPDEFRKLLGHNAQGLIVHAVGGLFFRAADQYEQLADYKRVATVLASGKQVWVYVDARSAPAGPITSTADPS